MIEFKNITKKYNNNTVLDNFSLRIKKGTVNFIMGESGVGKTTLLHIAAGLVKADQGQIEFDGKFAIMFQEPRLLPSKSAIENIRAVISKDKLHLAEKYLSAVGLSEAADMFPEQLSGGMAQRTAFARFLAYAEDTEADLLLLDEPFSALDGETAEKMLALLSDLAYGKTLLLVTHNVEYAEKMKANIIYL